MEYIKLERKDHYFIILKNYFKEKDEENEKKEYIEEN